MEYVILFIVVTMIQSVYGYLMYKQGVKYGVTSTVVKVCTENEIIKEE